MNNLSDYITWALDNEQHIDTLLKKALAIPDLREEGLAVHNSFRNALYKIWPTHEQAKALVARVDRLESSLAAHEVPRTTRQERWTGLRDGGEA